MAAPPLDRLSKLYTWTSLAAWTAPIAHLSQGVFIAEVRLRPVRRGRPDAPPRTPQLRRCPGLLRRTGCGRALVRRVGRPVVVTNHSHDCLFGLEQGDCVAIGV